MNNHIQTTFLREAVSQCEFALNAVRGLNNVLPRIGPAAKAGDWDLSRTLQQEVFRSIHSFLTHASNVSRIFWPGRPRKNRNESEHDYTARLESIPKLIRAATLREATGLSPDHVLRKRALRDHLEHFDERLDNWSATSARHNYVQDTIGPANAIVGIDETDMMRWFDPTTNTMRFRGEVYDLQELTAAVEQIGQTCVAAIERIEQEDRERRRSARSAPPSDQTT